MWLSVFLTSAEEACIPRRKVGFFKYWWDIELDKLKQKSIEAHKLWLAASRPMSGDIYNSKRVSKAQYRHSLRCHQRQGHSTISNELHDLLLQKDQTNFWKSWGSKFKRGKSRCPNASGFTNDFDIANAFVNFASVCSHNSPIVSIWLFNKSFMTAFHVTQTPRRTTYVSLKSYLTSWLAQNLSNHVSKRLTVLTSKTWFGRRFKY